jgi:hypothetical protein
MVEAWMSFLRRSPRKSHALLRSGPGSSPEPSFGRKLFGLTQASNNVPSTEKWSLDNNLLPLSCDSTAARNWLVTSARHLTLQLPVPVLGEARGVPHIVLDVEPDKPAVQQVVVDPLDQLPLRTGRMMARTDLRIFPVCWQRRTELRIYCLRAATSPSGSDCVPVMVSLIQGHLSSINRPPN